MKNETVLKAIQNVGATMFAGGFILAIMFVHYIEPIYIVGIVSMLIGGIDVMLCERILDVVQHHY